MSLLGNLLWIILGGFLIALFYLIGGLVLCLTIVGIPFGVQLIKLSLLALAPFGKEVNTEGSASGLLEIVMNVLWWIFGGVEVAITHLVLALILAITIVGLPFASSTSSSSSSPWCPLVRASNRHGRRAPRSRTLP